MLAETGVPELSGAGKGAQESALVRHVLRAERGEVRAARAGVALRVPMTLLVLALVRAPPSLRVPEGTVLTHMDSIPQQAACLPALWMLVKSPQPLYISDKILRGKVNTVTQNPRSHSGL